MTPISRWLRHVRPPLTHGARNLIRSDSQSLGFAVDLCNVIQQELKTERDIRLTLLDVGARTASGSNLIAQVFHPDSYSQIKLDVTANDLEDTHAESARSLFPDVTYHVGDVRDITERFDIVTCSHMLEHVEDPGPVVEHLRSIANRLIIIAAPYAETLDETNPNPSNHKFSFDQRFFKAHPPERLVIFRSPHWSTGSCFFAVYRPSRKPDA